MPPSFFVYPTICGAPQTQDTTLCSGLLSVADGADEKEAVGALVELVNDNFGE